MKYGMNMLLWTTNVDASHDKVFEMLKETGYDGVEIPIFQLDDANFQRIGKTLSSLKLEATTVVCVGAAVNPISPDAAIRKSAMDHLKKAVDLTRICGSKILAGPFHSAIGEFTGTGPTAEPDIGDDGTPHQPPATPADVRFDRPGRAPVASRTDLHRVPVDTGTPLVTFPLGREGVPKRTSARFENC